jgi:hypothetical protein
MILLSSMTLMSVAAKNPLLPLRRKNRVTDAFEEDKGKAGENKGLQTPGTMPFVFLPEANPLAITSAKTIDGSKATRFGNRNSKNPRHHSGESERKRKQKIGGIATNPKQDEAVEEGKKTISDGHTAILSPFSSGFQG